MDRIGSADQLIISKPNIFQDIKVMFQILNLKIYLADHMLKLLGRQSIKSLLRVTHFPQKIDSRVRV